MIDFSTSGPELSRACFGGSLDDIVAEVAMMLGLIYGSIKSKNEDAAKHFEKLIMSTFIDPDIRNKVFSSEIYDAVCGSDGCISIAVDNSEEFQRQLMELLNNEGK